MEINRGSLVLLLLLVIRGMLKWMAAATVTKKTDNNKNYDVLPMQKQVEIVPETILRVVHKRL